MKLQYKKALAVGGVALFIPGVVTAGFFDPFVIDIAQEFHSAQQLAQEIQMVGQLAQELQTMQYNIRSFPTRVKTTFRGFSQPFYRPTTGNVFGETARWANLTSGALYSYSEAKDAWDGSSLRIQPSSLFQNRLVNSLALIHLANTEISDAAGTNALRTVNALRNQQQAYNDAIRNLQESCLNAANDTAAMQANCTSGTGILNAQAAQSTNALLSSIVDLSVAQIKKSRDHDAGQVNFESRTREYQATEPTGVSLSQQGLRNFRFQF